MNPQLAISNRYIPEETPRPTESFGRVGRKYKMVNYDSYRRKLVDDPDLTDSDSIRARMSRITKDGA